MKNRQEVIKDPMAETRAKVDSVLQEKFSEMIAAYQSERDETLSELTVLQQSLNSLEEKKSILMAERIEKAKGIFGAGSEGVFEIDLKVRRVEKEITRLDDQIGKLFSKLTELPKIDFALLNFLSRYERSKP